MRFRKIAIFICIISLSLIFLIESSTAMVCFCGRCFPRASQDVEMMIKATSSKDYSNNNIRICNIEKGMTLKGAHFPKPVHDFKIFFASIINSLIDISSAKQFSTDIKLFHDYEMVQSFPICLKTLSIRC